VGFTTAVYFSSDGTAVSRTDAGGNWTKAPGAPGANKWQPLLTGNNTYDARAVPDLGALSAQGQFFGVPGTAYNKFVGPGSSYEVAISNSNSSVIILTNDTGFLWRTTDGGSHFNILTGFSKTACAAVANVCWAAPGCAQLNAQDATVSTSCAIRTAQQVLGGCSATVCPVEDGNMGLRYTGPHFAIDPNNPNYMAIVFGTLGLFVSSDEGVTWTRITTSASSASMVPNGTNLTHSQVGGFVCYDTGSTSGGSTPGIYVFIEGRGVFHSTDHGATWNQSNGESSTGMPTAAFSMTCAPSSASDPTKSRVYLTTESANTPSKFVDVFTPGSPGTWTTNSDTTNAGANGRGSVVAGWVQFDPNDTSGPGGISGRMVAIAENVGEVAISTDPYDATPVWTGYPALASAPSCPASIGNQSVLFSASSNWSVTPPYICLGAPDNGAFDPSVTTVNQHIMYVGIGVGTWSIIPEPTNVSSNNNMTWTFRSLNEENGNGKMVRASPNGVVIVNVDDRSQFAKHTASWAGGSVTPSGSDLDSVPTRYLPAANLGSGINYGYDAMYSQAHPNVWVSLGGASGGPSIPDIGSISTDDGETWTMFRVICSAAGGSCVSNGTDTNIAGHKTPWEQIGGVAGGAIASLDGSSIVYVPGKAGTYQGIWHSANGGLTWTQITPTGVASGGAETGWGANAGSRVMCEDGTNYYLYNHGTAASSAMAGIWISSDGGATWTLTDSGFMKSYASDLGTFGHLTCTPGKTGDLWWDSGLPGASVPFYPLIHIPSCTVPPGHCTKAAASTFSNVTDLWTHGWGAMKPGGDGYPAMYIAGWVRSSSTAPWIYGIWRSDNADQNPPTWTQLSGSYNNPGGFTYPLGLGDQPMGLDGDKNTWNRAFMSFLNSSMSYWQ
jgi:hypothetical protein